MGAPHGPVLPFDMTAPLVVGHLPLTLLPTGVFPVLEGIPHIAYFSCLSHLVCLPNIFGLYRHFLPWLV